MCVSGIPESTPDHAIRMVRAALEILEYMHSINKSTEKDILHTWQIRIGINTGPISAGVVGTKKFCYDIWGDSVNVASRMESSGEPGRINISGSTYELIKDKFQCEHRGKIQAKNKGNIDMYFVLGPK
jgi:class 3 adenylate cyclase